MEKEELYFYMICPKCYQHDILTWKSYERYVLDANPPKAGGRIKKRMEGEYLCPYGCSARMLNFAVGSYDEVSEKSDKLFKKYIKNMPQDCCTLMHMGL